MKIQLNRQHVIIGASILMVIVVAVFALIGSVYFWQSEDPVTTSVARALNMPAARVGSQSVSYDKYLAHLNSLRVFLSGPAAAAQGLSGTVGPAEKRSALERAVRLVAIEEMAIKADLVATSLDVERGYAGLVAQAGTSTAPGEIESLLRDQFGWSETDFKKYVIRPALMEDALRAKRARETGDDATFDRELEARLQQSDVVRYLRLPSLANEPGT